MEYPGYCNVEQVRRAIYTVNHNCSLRGIIETLVRNATEGGFTPYLELDGQRMEISDYFEASEIHDRWTPVTAQIFRHILTTGYACVIVDEHAEDADDRIFVVDQTLYDLRWTTKNFRRVYVAVPATTVPEATGIITSNNSRNIGAHGTNAMNNKPIKNSFVHVMYDPDGEHGDLTSPTAQTLTWVTAADYILNVYTDVITSQSKPPIFTEVTQQTSSEAEVPFMLNALEADGEIGMRRVTIPGNTATARHLRTAQQLADMGRFGSPSDAPPQDTAASVASKITYNGRPVADVTAGRVIAKEASAPTMDVSAAVEMYQEITALIGRAFGVSAEYLRGGEGGGSKLIAGVEASRRQLAATIETLQMPAAKFLQHVFARYYKPLLYDVLKGSRPMRGQPAAQSRRSSIDEADDTVAERPRSRERSRSRERDSDRNVEENEDDTYAREGRGKKVKAAAAPAGRKGMETKNRITISFNKMPFLDYDSLRKALLDGVVSADGFRDNIGRMYRIQLSEMTNSYSNGPQELLLDAILEDLETRKAQRRILDVQLKQQKYDLAHPQVPTSTSGAGHSATPAPAAPRKRTDAEHAHAAAHEAGPPSTGVATAVRREKKT